MHPYCLQIIIKKFRKNSSLVTMAFNELTYSTLQCDEFIRQLITGGDFLEVKGDSVLS